jgi:hypothetical protein
MSRPHFACLLIGSFVIVMGCDQPESPSAGQSESSVAPQERARPLYRAATLTSYSAMCSGGEPFTGATPYAKKPGRESKTVFFDKHLDAKTPAWNIHHRKQLGAIVAKDPADVELVVCSELKRKGDPSYCRYYGAEVTIYDMTHDVRILEATTGKVLAQHTFELDRRTEYCDGAVSSSHFKGASPEPMLLSLLLPFQGEGIALPKIERVSDLNAVCSGSPFPQAAAYEGRGDTRVPVHLVYFPTAGQSNVIEGSPDGISPSRSSAEDPMAIPLVACLTGKPQKKKATCAFTGGKQLEMYDGEIEVAVYETATRKLVETRSFKATSRGCPWSHKFYGNVDKRMDKAEPALARYLKSLEGGPEENVAVAKPARRAAPKAKAKAKLVLQDGKL